VSDVIDQIGDLVVHAGLLYRPEVKRLATMGRLKANGTRVGVEDSVQAGDQISAGGDNYMVIAGGEGRLQLIDPSLNNANTIAGKVRAHCGYHKCLTMFSRKVYKRACRVYTLTHGLRPNQPTAFRHFYHRIEAFYNNANKYGVCSISGHKPDLDRFEDLRVVRFVRDPRDLMISSYYYHKRGAERWSKLTNPSDADWMVVNGHVPSGIPEQESLSGYLSNASLEKGLQAEMEFRQFHFESMMQWPLEDPRVLLFRYEDILGREPEVFEQIFDFYKLPKLTGSAAKYFANKYRLGKAEVKKDHVRNAKSQQWRDLFTPELKQNFNHLYSNLLERYGYPLE
jgi:hypothetical protein